MGAATLSLDITVLRLLRQRDRHHRYSKAVPPQALERRVQVLLDDFGRYFHEFPDAHAIEPGAFMLWFTYKHPKLKPEELDVYRGVITAAMAPVDPALESGLMERLIMAETAARVTGLLERYTAGDDVDLFQELQAQVDDTQVRLSRKVRTPQVLTPIEELLAGEQDDSGLTWRLGCLNRHIKAVRPGDFIIVAARPDQGKTTFCATELTHFATQVDAVWPGEARSILWLNNEGPGGRIVTRCFQAALDATVEDMAALAAQPSKTHRTLLHEQYALALGGRPGVLRVFDIHGMNTQEVERLIEKYRPAVVLFDMIDNIVFAGAASHHGERTDQVLEAMYQWARLMGVKHGCAVMATSQISADGDGMQYPTLGMLKDSKTGKQGAADLILTLGAVNDGLLQNSRYLGTTKNKKGKAGVSASPMTEVRIDKHRGRFKEFT